MKFTAQYSQEILKRISDGKTLRAISIEDGFSRSSFVEHVYKAGNEVLAEQYARSMDDRADTWADLSFETALDPDQPPEHRKIVSSEIHWHIERAKPRKYGSHQTIQLDGDLRVTRTKDEVDRIVRAAAEADD